MISSKVSVQRLQTLAVAVVLLVAACTAPPQKKNYLLNYVPDVLANRLKQGPYPFVMRVREFEIEEAYARPQIVYRRNPYELQYYFYRVWAIKPTRMITDIVAKHLTSANLVSTVVRRYDEGAKPDYELSGLIEAIEEYDSETIWFSHIALRFKLTRLSDAAVLYNRRFDQRKRVYENKPEYVVREMSQIMNHIMDQVTHDLDVSFAREYGLRNTPPSTPEEPDSTEDTPEMWNQ